MLDVAGRVLDIVGLTRGVEGALRDLNAKVTDREIKIELAADVLFDFDKHELRAEAVPVLTNVAAWLAKDGGIPASRFTTRGWGKTKPVAPNTRPDGTDDPDGRQKNRRVEITVRKL